jgi:hypothetical protein
MKPSASLVRLGLAVVTLVACTNGSTPPRHVLTGTWVDTTRTFQLQLSASSTGADLTTSCSFEHFPPIELDDSLRFQAQSVRTGAVGLFLVPASVTVTGQVVGDRVILLFGEGQGSSEVDTLKAGRRSVTACNA